MDTLGRHLLAEYHGCDLHVLDDEQRVQALMRGAAEAAGATVVACVFHRFSPQGVSGVVVIEESHLSIHTWPETGYAAVDFYTCGDCAPERAHAVLRAGLEADRAELLTVERGLTGPSSLAVGEHRREGGDPARPGLTLHRGEGPAPARAVGGGRR